jgi:hypothetical protein
MFHYITQTLRFQDREREPPSRIGTERGRRPTWISNSPVLILKPSGAGGRWSRAKRLWEAPCRHTGAGVRAAHSSPGTISTRIHSRYYRWRKALSVDSVTDLPSMHCRSASDQRMMQRSTVDFIKVQFDFQRTLCVSIAFGSCAARNTFP